jgi:vacuolar-type H+-ATPase subunit H
MKQAMKVMQRFSENESDYLLYQSRLDAALKENTYISALEDAMREKEQAVREKKQAAREKEQAVKEMEQAVKEMEQSAREMEQFQKKFNDLLKFLENKGIVPDKDLMLAGQ